MPGRLRTDVQVSALVRRVNDAGGLGVVLAKGDAVAGGVLIVGDDREGAPRMVERGIGPSGGAELIAAGPADSNSEMVETYWRRRRSRDPDLWVVALDIPKWERFVAETILAD